MKRILLLLSVFTSVMIYGQTTVNGYVYNDANGNGKRERNEQGIANVAISNGCDVVLTNEEGKYSLAVGDDNIISVIKPSGYKLPLNNYNQPQSYKIHKPGGSPKSNYPGVAPTGKLPKSLDFALTKYDEPEVFTSFVFGDTQTYNEREIEYLKKGVIDDVKTIEGISFGITLGDLVGDSLYLHLSYKDAIKEIGLPWFNVIGNHDINYDATVDSLSDETFESNFGPANYAFNYGKAHFIVLDDILYPDPRDGKGYWGGLRKDQFAFIANDLKHVPTDRLIIISMHIPLSEVGSPDAFNPENRLALYKLLNDYPRVLFLTAHTHFQVNSFIGKNEGLNREIPIHDYNVGTSCGDWYSGVLNEKGVPVSTMRDGTPKGYALLNISGNEYTIDYKVVDKPKDYQISIYNPKVVPYNGRWGNAGIYANFFMGTDDSTVEFRIDGGDWRKMSKVYDYDPAYYHYVQDWDYVEDVRWERRPSNPVRSTHLWRSAITYNYPVGTHKIEVRATDIFGRTFVSNSSYEIKELK